VSQKYFAIEVIENAVVGEIHELAATAAAAAEHARVERECGGPPRLDATRLM
jgi:hypothetical protein